MPASTKPDSKAFSEAPDPIKQVVCLLERKVRNLEKRKNKLDLYKVRHSNGEVLEKEQEEAIDKFGEVVQNLVFAKELQKQFAAMSQEAEKALRKQAKRDRADRQMLQLKKIRELLQLQNLLDNLGAENVRCDFKSGRYGAVVLTEENLDQLDGLYKLISPTRDGESAFSEQVSIAAEHIANLLDAREKIIMGTTYKELKELILLMQNCGYFENAPKYEEETSQPVDCAATEQDNVGINSAEPEAVNQNVAPSTLPEVPTEETKPTVATVEPLVDVRTEHDVEPMVNNIDNDSFFTTDTPFPRQRPFQEIVSSVQGNFNFLQESTIDLESPHMDPAVVVAHSMPPTSSSTGQPLDSSSIMSSPGFTNQSYEQQEAQQLEVSAVAAVVEPPPHVLPRAQPSVVSQQNPDYSSQGYSQNAITQSLPTTDSLFRSVEEGQSAHSLIGQSVNDATAAQFDMPSTMGIPSQTQDDPQSRAVKKFTMNANAAVFQSMYSHPHHTDSSLSTDSKGGQLSPQSDYNHTGNYQAAGFPRGFANRNFRSGRGNRGGGSMNNGFSRGGGNASSSGSSTGTNSGIGGRSGGGYNGRSGYTSFPGGRDYRTNGYNSFNGNTFGNGFQKRVNSSVSGGLTRGGLRSGAIRGQARGGGTRGGRGNGGLLRPNFS